VKLSRRRLVFGFYFAMAVVWCGAASVAPAAKDKEKQHEGKEIDSGSFGVFQGGHRVGTETFSIYETSYGSIIESEFKTENTTPVSVQASVLQLNAKGEIRHYDWKEVSPERAESVVVPNEEFLNQKWHTELETKEHEQPYLLPPSTNILDDYFFIHRELLAWKYLQGDCKVDKGMMQCTPKQRAQFGTLNPRQHTSAPLAAEFIGREVVALKSGPQDLLKLELKNDSGTWQLWLNDKFMLMRVNVLGENTIVERD
jgi:hypothetical protein